jgi:hypothetical protein
MTHAADDGCPVRKDPDRSAQRVAGVEGARLPKGSAGASGGTHAGQDPLTEQDPPLQVRQDPPPYPDRTRSLNRTRRFRSDRTRRPTPTGPAALPRQLPRRPYLAKPTPARPIRSRKLSQ